MQFPLISNQCLVYVLGNQTLPPEQIHSQMQNDPFIMSVKTQRKTERAMKDASVLPYIYLSEVHPKLREVCGVCELF